MKKMFIAALGLAGIAASAQAAINMMSDIEYWVGSGSNEAAFVLQWNDGKTPVSQAWGYRWEDGTTRTGADMFSAIFAADSRLSVVYNPDFPTTVFSIHFDTNGNGSTVVPGTPGFLSEGGTLADATDRYQEGWFTGYLEYFVIGGNFTYDVFDDAPPYLYQDTFTYDEPGSMAYNGQWFKSGIGADERELINGSWDAWSFSPNFVSFTPQQPIAAVPEPSSLLLMMAGSVFLMRRRRISS